jgi:ABC-type multidrug transport system fused ATPase/permease subunit
MEYRFSGQITLDDYIQFNENVTSKIVDFLKNSKNVYKFPFSEIIKYIFCVFLLGILIYNLLPILLEFESEIIMKIFTNPKIIIILILFFLIIIFILIFPRIMRNLMRNVYKKYYDSNKTITELCYYNITENVIKLKSESEDVCLTKEKINKIKYDTDSIYIYIGLNMAYIIKKRFLENEKTFEELQMFIKNNYDTIN